MKGKKRKERRTHITAQCGGRQLGRKPFPQEKMGTEERTGGSCKKMRMGGRQRTARDILDEKLWF